MGEIPVPPSRAWGPGFAPTPAPSTSPTTVLVVSRHLARPVPDVAPEVLVVVAHELRRGAPFSGVTAIAEHLHLPRETVRDALVVLERHVPEAQTKATKRWDEVRVLVARELKRGPPFSEVSAIATHLQIPEDTARRAVEVLEQQCTPARRPAPSKRWDLAQKMSGVEVVAVRPTRARARPR
jgi:DNA-binding IclR family transcriptional regulator